MRPPSGDRLSLAHKRCGCVRVVLIWSMQAEGRFWRKIREPPMFRCVFLTRESDELTDYRNKVKQAH
jgi:hypothetical protein